MNTQTRWSRDENSRRHGSRLRSAVALMLMAAFAATAAAQNTPPLRMWAAQTTPDLVSLTWDGVPGANEYRIYLGDPGSPATFRGRPASVLGANSRNARMNVTRVVDGITLVAVGADGSVLLQAPFNRVIPATSFLPPAAPAGATAQATSPTEVTVTWDAVPGATAYLIGRAAYKSGWMMLCGLCSTEPRYVDRNVMSGLPHSYSVAAIFPAGVSTRVTSNTVTPGATPAVTTPPATTTTTSSSTTSSTGSTTLITVPQPVQVARPTDVTAVATGPGLVRIEWQLSTTSSVTGYVVLRTIRGEVMRMNYVGPTTQSYDDNVFPITLFAEGPARAIYSIVAMAPEGSAQAQSNEVIVQPLVVDASGTAPGAPAPCVLEYQRADNMWASFGRPVGLGTESVSVPPGQRKVFSTDWKYEKMRNDGVNYYGSHLRVATNKSSRQIELMLRSFTPSGLLDAVQTRNDAFLVWLAPNTTRQFQADLLEVFCDTM